MMEVSLPGVVEVTFTIHYVTEVGQNIFLSGSNKDLGFQLESLLCFNVY